MRLEEMLGAPAPPVDTNVSSALANWIPGQMTVEECITDAEAPQFETATTPSGMEVYYQWAPKRLYRLRDEDDRLLRDGAWTECPSVTTVLGVLEKPALVWWGQGVSADGVCELVRRGLLMVVAE